MQPQPQLLKSYIKCMPVRNEDTLVVFQANMIIRFVLELDVCVGVEY
jgi:hypothetical protein